MAYKLKLPQELSKVHDTFLVCYLKKCISDENLVILIDEMQVNTKVYFVENLVEIMDREIKRRNKIRIPIVKVRCNSLRGLEFTWEYEDQMKHKYPIFFNDAPSTSGTT